jgi:hypothetical protein
MALLLVPGALDAALRIPHRDDGTRARPALIVDPDSLSRPAAPLHALEFHPATILSGQRLAPIVHVRRLSRLRPPRLSRCAQVSDLSPAHATDRAPEWLIIVGVPLLLVGTVWVARMVIES